MPQSDWRPIDTYDPAIHDIRAIICGQNLKGIWWVEEGRYDQAPGDWMGWIGRIVDPPTYWQPLPPPPASDD
jgi:hypothetical protein